MFAPDTIALNSIKKAILMMIKQPTTKPERKGMSPMRLRYDKNAQDKDNAIFMDFMQKVMGDAIGNFSIKINW